MPNVTEREERKQQKILEEIMAESFPNLVKNINIHNKRLNKLQLG